jgi:hypothetical protein
LHWFSRRRLPTSGRKGELATRRELCRCLSVIRDVVMHFTWFILVIIFSRKRILQNSEVMKTAWLWMPGYFSCETWFLLKPIKVKLLDLSFKPETQWKSAHSVCRFSGASSILMGKETKRNGNEFILLEV